MFDLLLLTLLVSNAQGMSDKYQLYFFKNGQNTTQGYHDDVIDVTLTTEGELTQQQSEIYNFAKDMSAIIFTGATYVQGSLTNAVDPPGLAPYSMGFLRPFRMEGANRTSLTTKIKFQVLLDDQATVTCKGAKFQIHDPDLHIRLAKLPLSSSTCTWETLSHISDLCILFACYSATLQAMCGV